MILALSLFTIGQTVGQPIKLPQLIWERTAKSSGESVKALVVAFVELNTSKFTANLAGGRQAVQHSQDTNEIPFNIVRLIVRTRVHCSLS